MGRLSEIEIFANVVENSSFTKAAINLGISKGYVSQQINNLERRLHTKLVHRTTRRISLTEEGHQYYQKCREILDALEMADVSLTQAQEKPQGRLRISLMPGMLGEHYIAPLIADFHALYPELNLELFFSVRRVDLISENFDCAIRLGELPDSTLVAKKFSAIRYYICASTTYLKNNSKPTHPNDLKNHNCLISSRQTNRWTFTKNKQRINIKVSGNFICNNAFGIHSAVQKGLGIARLPEMYLKNNKTKLGILLKDWQYPASDLWIVYPQRELMPLRLKLFIEFMVQRFSLSTIA